MSIKVSTENSVISFDFAFKSVAKMSRRHHHCHPNRNAIIRNQKSGLVLDANEYEVKLQHFTGYPSQLWRFEEVSPGKYIIINHGNGKVLDIQGGAGNRHNLITYGKHGGVNQQWFINSDGTIVSAAGNLAVDIFNQNFCAGNNLIAFTKHGAENQKFHLQYQ